MLKTTVAVEDEYNSFTRPAIYDSVRRVLEYYGVSSKSRIFFNGRNEITKLIGSNSTDRRFLDIHTDGIYDDKIYVTSEVDYTEFNNGYANQRRSPTERPIWINDEDIPIAIYPAFEGVKVDVGITAMFNSLASAQSFRKRISRLQANQATDISFNPVVHIPINNSILELLEDLHGLYSKNDPTTPLLGDWFDKHAKTPINKISNVAGNHERLVTPLKLQDIGIIFSDSTIERTKPGSSYGRYEVTLSYHFYLNSIMNWELEYPLNIYQDEIPSKWIPRRDSGHVNSVDVRRNQETQFGYLGNNSKPIQVPYFLKLPSHDVWEVPNRRYYQPVLQARLKLEDVPEQVLVTNVFDIPGFTWNPRVKEYILANRDLAFTQYSTLFPISFFSNDIRVNIEDLSLDELGCIRLHRSPVIKNTYRLVIGLNLAIRDLTDEFWDTIRANPEYVDLVIDVIHWKDWDKIKQDGWGSDTGIGNSGKWGDFYNPSGAVDIDNMITGTREEVGLGGLHNVSGGLPIIPIKSYHSGLTILAKNSK